MGNIMEGTQQILFSIGDGKYGLDVNCINGIERISEISPVPDINDHILGLIKLRNTIFPVYSLRRKLGLKEEQDASGNTNVILVKSNGMDIAYKVDNVQDIVKFEPGDLHDAPAIIQDEKTSYIRKIASLNGKLVMLFDENKILSEQEINSVALCGA